MPTIRRAAVEPAAPRPRPAPAAGAQPPLATKASSQRIDRIHGAVLDTLGPGARPDPQAAKKAAQNLRQALRALDGQAVPPATIGATRSAVQLLAKRDAGIDPGLLAELNSLARGLQEFRPEQALARLADKVSRARTPGPPLTKAETDTVKELLKRLPEFTVSTRTAELRVRGDDDVARMTYDTSLKALETIANAYGARCPAYLTNGIAELKNELARIRQQGPGLGASYVPPAPRDPGPDIGPMGSSSMSVPNGPWMGGWIGER